MQENTEAIFGKYLSLEYSKYIKLQSQNIRYRKIDQ